MCICMKFNFAYHSRNKLYSFFQLIYGHFSNIFIFDLLYKRFLATLIRLDVHGKPCYGYTMAVLLNCSIYL